MNFFIHPENQKILWTLIKKHPLYPYFSQTLVANNTTGELWFRNNIEELYDMLYPNYKNASITSSAEENQRVLANLIQMNKYALSHLVIQIKKNMAGATMMGATMMGSTMMGANANTTQQINNIYSSVGLDNPTTSSLGMNGAPHGSFSSFPQAPACTMSTTNIDSAPPIGGMSSFVFPSYEAPDTYNPEQIRKEREQRTIKEFEQLKEKYDELHMKPIPAQLNLTTIVEKSGNNVAELAKIQEEMRQLDSQYTAVPPQLESFEKKLSHAFTVKYTGENSGI